MARPKNQETVAETKAEPTTRVTFNWVGCMPDHRRYKQNSVTLIPQEAFVVVEVPLRSEYIHNATTVLAASLSGNTVKSVLTPLGMRYCMDQLEAVLPDVPVSGEDFSSNEDDEFEDDEPSTTKASSKVAEKESSDEDEEWE